MYMFQEGLSTFIGFQTTIHVDQEANPVHCKAYIVPSALMTTRIEGGMSKFIEHDQNQSH